jgi:glutamate synthase (ferredoxin)
VAYEFEKYLHYPGLLRCVVPAGLRSDTSIVVETAQAFSTHHAAMLIGYGAHALCPYLAYETARQWRLSSRTQSLVKSGKVRAGLLAC